MTTITNIKVVEHSIKNSDNEDLAKLVELIKNDADIQLVYGDKAKNPLSALPNYLWYTVSFVLNNTFSSFANAIRRTLIGEIPVKCLTFDEAELKKTDDFILSDMLLKNINLIPIMQNYESKNGKISLMVHNETDDVIDVFSGNIQVERGKVSDLILDPNIVIIRLRPGKNLHIDNLYVVEGTCKDNAAMFSLLDNVKYQPIDDDIEPFDSFTGQGTRSIEYDPKKFALSFTTTGNIQPRDVIHKCADVLHDKFTRAKAKINDYIKSLLENKDNSKAPYNAFGLEISMVEDIIIYKFLGEYITFAYLLAHQCYRLDPNIEFCTPTIDRYDSEIAILKIKHADANKLILSAIDAILSDIETFKKIDV